MAKKIDVYMPLIIGDWLKGTRGMKASVKGVYIGLLLYQWDNGFIPDDPDELALIEPEVGSVWVFISDKFPVVAPGRRQNSKCEEVRNFFQKQANNGRKGGRPKKENPKGNPNSNPKQNPNPNPPFELEYEYEYEYDNEFKEGGVGEELDGDVYPSEFLERDEGKWELLERVARDYKVDLRRCADDWDGWYVNKFTGWRADYARGQLTIGALYKSFETWIRDPKSKKQNGNTNSKSTSKPRAGERDPTATTFGTL